MKLIVLHLTSFKLIELHVFVFLSSSTDSEGLEVDVESLDADHNSLRPKRKYRKKTQLSISQRKNYKQNIPVQLTPTVEFKSARQLQHEKRGKNIVCSLGGHSLELHVSAEETQWCLANPLIVPILPHSSADEAETDYYSGWGCFHYSF